MKLNSKIAFLILFVLIGGQLMAQNNNSPYMRVARIVVDSAQLESYKAALTAGVTAAVNMEPGVLSITAVYEKNHPTNVTVFEIYADVNAYRSHVRTPHFLKYKSTVEHMVKSLELVDVSPIVMKMKQN